MNIHPQQQQQQQQQQQEPVKFFEIIKKRWKIIKIIGKGGFGYIYKALDLKTESFVAIKFEKRKNCKSYLSREAKYYKKFKGGDGIPRLLYYGSYNDMKILVLELLGPSLSELYYKCSRRFSLKTVLMLAEQMVTRIELLHKQGVLHRDIKPGNFLLGQGSDYNKVYIIDFGLSSEFIESDGNHIEFSTRASFHGTHRYASINSHFRYEQSRRDDLEALAYVLIFFLKGTLPWQNLKCNKKRKRKIIGQVKRITSTEALTQDLPKEFKQYLAYCKGLGFVEEPDYDKIRSLFRRCFERNGFQKDLVFDWLRSIPPKDDESLSSSHTPPFDDCPMNDIPQNIGIVDSNMNMVPVFTTTNHHLQNFNSPPDTSLSIGLNLNNNNNNNNDNHNSPYNMNDFLVSSSRKPVDQQRQSDLHQFVSPLFYKPGELVLQPGDMLPVVTVTPPIHQRGDHWNSNGNQNLYQDGNNNNTNNNNTLNVGFFNFNQYKQQYSNNTTSNPHYSTSPSIFYTQSLSPNNLSDVSNGGRLSPTPQYNTQSLSPIVSTNESPVVVKKTTNVRRKRASRKRKVVDDDASFEIPFDRENKTNTKTGTCTHDYFLRPRKKSRLVMDVY